MALSDIFSDKRGSIYSRFQDYYTSFPLWEPQDATELLYSPCLALYLSVSLVLRIKNYWILQLACKQIVMVTRCIFYYSELDKLTSADDQDEKIVKVHMPGQIKTVSVLNLLHL